MVALPSLRGLQAFEAAARTGSFAAAAEELSVSPAAVSQLIRTVEEQMGRKLFHRVNRRVVLNWNDPDKPLGAGRIGFRSMSGVSMIAYDKLKVWKVSKK